MLRQMAITGLLGLAVVTATPAVRAQAVSETFTATATVKTAGKPATAPVTIVIDRKMPQAEADKFLAAFKSGGADALRKALVGVPPTGSVTIGTDKPVPTRLTLERATGGGRLITIVTDQPLRFLGGNAPGAKPKEGYDFAVIDLTVSAAGTGTGQISPAAKISTKGGAFVVSDYSAEYVQLVKVSKSK